MATFKEYENGRVRVRIRLQGVTETQTFISMSEAQHYASQRESEIYALTSKAISSTVKPWTFGQIVQDYLVSSSFFSKSESTRKTENNKSKIRFKAFRFMANFSY